MIGERPHSLVLLINNIVEGPGRGVGLRALLSQLKAGMGSGSLLARARLFDLKSAPEQWMERMQEPRLARMAGADISWLVSSALMWHLMSRCLMNIKEFTADCKLLVTCNQNVRTEWHLLIGLLVIVLSG